MECTLCDGTGKYLQPKDEKKYDEVYDIYDAQGSFTHQECRDKALKKVGYDEIECPKCNGTGTI